MTTNQNLYPTIITNTVKNSNTVVNAQTLTGGTLSSQFDLQGHRIVKGLCIFSSTVAGNYFIVDPITGAPIQLGKGDIVNALTLYGPSLLGGTSARLGLSPTPTFDTATGVPLTPAAPAFYFTAAGVVLADLQAGITATLAASNIAAGFSATPLVLTSLAEWLTVTTAGTFASGSLGVVLSVSNPGSVLV